MTNFERIKAMSIEEMEQFLDKIINDAYIGACGIITEDTEEDLEPLEYLNRDRR